MFLCFFFVDFRLLKWMKRNRNEYRVPSTAVVFVWNVKRHKIKTRFVVCLFLMVLLLCFFSLFRISRAFIEFQTINFEHEKWKEREQTKNIFIELICELIDDWLNFHTLWANGKWSINNTNHSIDQTCCYWILIGVGVWDEHKRKSMYIANFQPRQAYRSQADSSHFYWHVMRPLNEEKMKRTNSWLYQ